jgi:hypothetical protein
MSANPKKLISIDTGIEANQNSWSSPPSGFFLELGLKRVTSSVVGNGTTTTVVTTSNHGFSTGNSVVISEVTPTGFNGTYTITVTNTTTFTYANATNDTATVQGTAQINDEFELLIDNEDFLLIQ